MIDTLQLAKDLEKAFPPAQAEAFSRTLVEDLATKDDLKLLGADLRAEIAQLEMKLTGKINDVRGEISDVRSEIKDLKVDIVRWIVGALLVNFFGVAGLMITLIKVIH